jgi:branched-chain amino acid transport system ATP-binding protein
VPEPDGVPLLAVRDLAVSYGHVPVLHGIDLAVGAGEILALLGVNGAGKSTLLRTISGVLRPRRGEVVFAGRRIDRLPAHEIVRRGLVHVPGGRGAFPGLTVAENLRLAASLAGRRDVRAAVEEVARRFPWVADRAGQPAGTLSGGEQQQLLLARALLARPRLLMIDELSLGLAPIVVERLLEIVGELNREGVTVIIVEQNVDLALSFAHRAVFLERGEVRFEGPAAALRDRPDLLRSVFLAGAREVVP